MTTTAGASKFFPKAQEGFTTTTSGLVASGASTVGLNSTGNYSNGDTVVLIIDPGVVGKEQSFTGVIDTSGVQVTGVVWLSGTNVPHVSGATVVDYVAAGHIGLISAGALVSHNADGTPKAGVTYPTPILTTPTITDFSNADHTHATAAQGGQLTGSTALVNSTVTADKLSTGAANTTVATSETTTSTTYAALSTAGPAVTCTVGANGLLLVGLYSEMSNNTANAFCEMSFDLSGANTLSAADTLALRFQAYTGGAIDKRGATFLLTGLTAGSTTVTAKYSVQTGGAGSGTGTFQDRRLFAVPL